MVEAVKFLLAETPARDAGYLPYAMQLTHLVEIFRIAPILTPEKRKEVLSWIWYTSVSQYFGGASTGQNSRDLETVRAFASGTATHLFVRDTLDLNPLLFDHFNLRTASSTTFALILNALQPETTLGGKPIDGSHFRVKSGKLFQSFSPASMAVMNLAKVLEPYGYVNAQQIINDGVLSSHALSSECVKACLNEDEAAFAEARGNLVASFISSLTGCKTVFRWEEGRSPKDDTLQEEIEIETEGDAESF